jgi:hypothetical protein
VREREWERVREREWERGRERERERESEREREREGGGGTEWSEEEKDEKEEIREFQDIIENKNIRSSIKRTYKKIRNKNKYIKARGYQLLYYEF